jgi:pimeloyl-ACP methyl ester carboxylesterase
MCGKLYLDKNMEAQKIPFIDFGGSGKTLHFLHANGYPPGCYRPLLELLSRRQHVTAMLMRPLWGGQRPEDLEDWLPLSQDLLMFFDQEAQGVAVIGTGHSIGATVTLRAAIREPQRFRALVLFDPALFQPHFILFWRLVKTLGLGRRLHPFIPGAERRRREFDDLDKLFNAYRERRIFRYFDDQALWAYIRGIVQPAHGAGHQLAFSPEWEAQIYYTGIWPDLDLWRALPTLKVPMLIIRGAETDTFTPGTAHMIKRLLPQTSIVTLERSTHLVPLEKPQETFDAICSFLEEV